MSGGTRIDYVATPQRMLDFYSENSSGILKTWMFIVLGGKSIYKNSTIASDLSTAQNKNQSYYYEGQQDFAIYIVVPSSTSVKGGEESDTARGYETQILKSIANFIFESDLSEGYHQPCVYVANEPDDYVAAYYVHRFDFLVKGFIQQEDTAAFSNGTPLKIIDGTFDNGLIFKPNLR